MIQADRARNKERDSLSTQALETNKPALCPLVQSRGARFITSSPFSPSWENGLEVYDPAIDDLYRRMVAEGRKLEPGSEIP